MTTSPSIARRALLAAGLMFGFYVLAITIAGALLAAPVLFYELTNHVPGQIIVACIVTGVVILWSIRPRFDRFTAPGPRLEREKHPRLFEDLEAVACATGQAMPAEVFLVGNVNAWVSQRGGMMGIGSRRIMGLGLPLMRTLTRSQLRAVLAHEFGHFHGGDTKLGPWVYKTRAAIFRTVQNLQTQRTGWVQAPFRWYGTMFLRVTHSVTRMQELSADQLAAHVAGSRALIDGLSNLHAFAPAFDVYWNSECQPLLNAGFLPPLSTGFAQFIGAPRIAEALRRRLDEELLHPPHSPFDTHPPLSVRIAAIERLPAGAALEDDPPAIDLLEDVEALERAMLAAVAGEKRVRELATVPWEDVGHKVYLPIWRALVRANARHLAGKTPEELPALARAPADFQAKVTTATKDTPPRSHAPLLARAVIGAALAVRLAERGARVRATPGMPVAFELRDETIEPFEAFEKLEKGELGEEAWRAQCARLGIAGDDLGRIEAEA